MGKYVWYIYVVHSGGPLMLHICTMARKTTAEQERFEQRRGARRRRNIYMTGYRGCEWDAKATRTEEE